MLLLLILGCIGAFWIRWLPHRPGGQTCLRVDALHASAIAFNRTRAGRRNLLSPFCSTCWDVFRALLRGPRCHRALRPSNPVLPVGWPFLRHDHESPSVPAESAGSQLCFHGECGGRGNLPVFEPVPGLKGRFPRSLSLPRAEPGSRLSVDVPGAPPVGPLEHGDGVLCGLRELQRFRRARHREDQVGCRFWGRHVPPLPPRQGRRRSDLGRTLSPFHRNRLFRLLRGVPPLGYHRHSRPAAGRLCVLAHQDEREALPEEACRGPDAGGDRRGGATEAGGTGGRGDHHHARRAGLGRERNASEAEVTNSDCGKRKAV